MQNRKIVNNAKKGKQTIKQKKKTIMKTREIDNNENEGNRQ